MTLRSLSTFLATVLLVAAAGAADADPNAPLHMADYKPPIRVACLGDSITFGVGATPGNSYPDQLERMLGDPFDVRNFGHSGAAVAKGEKHNIWGTKEYNMALLFHPDVVVILLGTNDTKPENWAQKAAFSLLYKELVVSFQKLSSHPRVFCCTAPYVARKGAFGINEVGVLEQIPLIQGVAKDWSAGVIDVHAALDKKDELFKDNVHPVTAGATVIAETVYKSLTGKDWTGGLPAAATALKPKPLIRVIENPGEISYRETFGLIASTAMPPEKLLPIKDQFDATVDEVEIHGADLEAQISENDGLRMKFKHSDGALAGQYKARVRALQADLLKYRRERRAELIALIPAEFTGLFGAEWVRKYVLDRLAAIASTLTPAQRKAIRELCRQDGAAFSRITNTPERSIEEVEVYKTVYEKVLDADQKKRVEPT